MPQYTHIPKIPFFILLFILPYTLSQYTPFLPTYPDIPIYIPPPETYENNTTEPTSDDQTSQVQDDSEQTTNNDDDNGNPLSLLDYVSILRQNNFFGTWNSPDGQSRPFKNFFNNPFGLMIIEALDVDYTQGSNYMAKLISTGNSTSYLHHAIKQVFPTKQYLGSLRMWSLLVKIYDGKYVDQNSANMFYKVTEDSPVLFSSKNSTLYVQNGSIEIFQKDGKGDSTLHQTCKGDFSIKFIDRRNSQPYRDLLGGSMDVGIQFKMNSSECDILVASEVLSVDGFEDTDQIHIYIFIATTLAVLQVLGAYKVKRQLRSRKAVFKLAVGSIWMTATVDYYMLILNLVLIFAYSIIFLVPFAMYMFLTFYLERDIIIRILQVRNKRHELDITDESCRSCGFHFGLSTLLFVFELVFILMSKLWVIHFTSFILLPQIFFNAKRDRPYDFNFYHIILMGASRLAFVIYIKAYPQNIFRLSPDISFVIIYALLMLVQVAILFLQTKYPRACFLCLGKKKRSRSLSEDDVCPICMCDLRNDTKSTVIEENLLDLGDTIETPCTHVFHIQCLKKWLKSKVECPVCREPIEEIMEEVASSEDEGSDYALPL